MDMPVDFWTMAISLALYLIVLGYVIHRLMKKGNAELEQLKKRIQENLDASKEFEDKYKKKK